MTRWMAIVKLGLKASTRYELPDTSPMTIELPASWTCHITAVGDDGTRRVELRHRGDVSRVIYVTSAEPPATIQLLRTPITPVLTTLVIGAVTEPDGGNRERIAA